MTNRHKVREEEVAPKGSNATIQYQSLAHCSHGCLFSPPHSCLVYVDTAALPGVGTYAFNRQKRTDASSGVQRSDTSSPLCAIDFNRIGM